MRTTTISDNCLECGNQIWIENETWIDNSGGDVCGINGDNEPHHASGNETLTIEEN
jgi:hypothetical protein